MARSLVRKATIHVVRAPEDLHFAARCASGDREALRELFQRERNHVHRTLFRLLGSNTHIDDLVQDAFLEIFRSLPGFRGEASLRTWIDRCTVRVAYAHFGRRTPLAQLECVPELPAKDPSAEERAALREAVRRLYAELDRLEAKQRVAFTLHAIDGRSLDDVARIMESSMVATKTRVWRARRAIEKRARKDALLAEFLGAARPEKDTRPCDRG
jgi:RNA polymerase sigma-70 factor (ECF subfamily)